VGAREPGSEVVEELTFEMEAELLDRWLAREAGTWDGFLAAQDGFLGKEVWLAPDAGEAKVGRCTVRVQIWWASHAQWKSVDPAGVEAADRRMGDLLRHPKCREYRLLRRA
jgi:uncharacterized protein (TIGR03792 family)